MLSTDRGLEFSSQRRVAAAEGEFITVLDATDTFYPSRLEKLIPLACEYGLASDNRRLVDESSHRTLGILLPLTQPRNTLSATELAKLNTPISILAQRELYGEGWATGLQKLASLTVNLRAIAEVGALAMAVQPLHEWRIQPSATPREPEDWLRTAGLYRRA